ncbi:MAG TPA: chemotaxis protein CheB, partial [Burkholderiales bacterium]|nr:chemotaxis protein CheB [Burkholderiales bacterium]
MTSELETARSQEQQEQFLIVGVGASAGGIDALKAFFSQVQKESGASYVVILHLSPDHESQLAELLQGVAAIPVVQVRERVKVEVDRAYVIPPNQSLSVEDGHLSLSAVTTQEQRRAPIDIFFRTLGDSQGARAVCVVLSGTGADGSAGLKRVKECGGLCIVQDPSEAAHDGMPRHAIETRLVDDVLPVSEIPAKIRAYRRHLDLVRGQWGSPETDEQALRDVLSQVRLVTGHDFSSYKQTTLLRRIERRLAIHELADLSAYAAWLKEHPDDARVLLKDLLISVTEFFRDPDAFEALKQEVIPRLFESKGVHDYVRV